jgi:hypothetical protein
MEKRNGKMARNTTVSGAMGGGQAGEGTRGPTASGTWGSGGTGDAMESVE